jgi:hypothetical protein
VPGSTSYRPGARPSTNSLSKKLRKPSKRPALPEVGSSASSSLLNSHHAPPALAPAAPRGGWLARIVGRKTDIDTAKPMSEAPNDRPTPPVAVSATTNDADEYNWSGFSCPYCEAPGFVSCRGGHLACDGTAQTRKDGRFHQCFCGQAGFISGMIKTFENERLSLEAQVDPTNALPAVRERQNSKPAAPPLPAPAQGLPAKR